MGRSIFQRLPLCNFEQEMGSSQFAYLTLMTCVCVCLHICTNGLRLYCSFWEMVYLNLLLGPVIFQAFPRLLSFTMIVKANLDFFLTMFVVTLFTYVMHGSVVQGYRPSWSKVQVMGLIYRILFQLYMGLMGEVIDLWTIQIEGKCPISCGNN